MCSHGKGSFGGDTAAAARKNQQISPIEFYEAYGEDGPKLSLAARQILNVSPNASPCETNWSEHAAVHSDSRNRLGKCRAERT